MIMMMINSRLCNLQALSSVSCVAVTGNSFCINSLSSLGYSIYHNFSVSQLSDI